MYDFIARILTFVILRGRTVVEEKNDVSILASRIAARAARTAETADQLQTLSNEIGGLSTNRARLAARLRGLADAVADAAQ